jgi:hypothetical protein
VCADVGDDDVGVLQRLQARLRVHVRDERGARVLEGLAALDVIVVVVAVHHVLDGRLGDLPDLRDIRRRRLEPPLGDGVGGDHAVGRHHKHRLMSAVAEQVDIVGDLLGLEERRRLGEGQERHGQRDGGQERQGERATPGHRHTSVGWISLLRQQ